VTKTEGQYAKLLARELRNGVWLSSHTLRTVEAAGRNLIIAPQIKHIDLNVLYLDIINEWHSATSSTELAPHHSQLHTFVKTENQFFEREDFEDVLGRQLGAFPTLSSITTKSTHYFTHEKHTKRLGGLAAELQTLRDRYKLKGLHVPYGEAPSLQMELKVFRAAAKAHLQPKEVSFCALPVDLVSQSDLFANVEHCYLFSVENMFRNDLPLKLSTLKHLLAKMSKLRTLHLVVGFLKWSNLFAPRPYSVLDWGHNADLSDVAWPASLEQLEIVHLAMQPSNAAFLDTLPKTVRCDIVEAKRLAPSNSLMCMESMYNVDVFG
jgi:hypothetical protein